MGLGIVLRPVAEPHGVGIVVPAARVARDAVDDLEADAGMIDADRHELRQVARAEPDGEPALVDRRRIDVADADHEHLHAVFVGVEAAERLAEHLRHAVAAVGLRVDAMVDRLVAPAEADRVVAGGEHDALHAVPARRLEHVVAADDVRLEDPLPRPFSISPACATVSSDWCSIAGWVSPAACGVAITSRRAASCGVGIWSGARPTSIAQPASPSASSAASSACSSTRLPRDTLMKKALFFILANAAADRKSTR